MTSLDTVINDSADEGKKVNKTTNMKDKQKTSMSNIMYQLHTY